MTDKYDLKNCCETKETWPKSLTMRSFIFIDGKEAEGRRFFEKHEVNSLKVWKSIVWVPNPNYLVVFAECSKNEVDKVAEALHDLENSMPILGYKDYDKVCEDFMNAVKELN